MSNPIYYVQECPICGRRLQIRVEYLGRKVVCPHCQGQLTAADPANQRCDCSESSNALLRRAEELLESVAQQKAQPRHSVR
jgi:DNA-directed RNA polymerase subunit RPC12/RpoP